MARKYAITTIPGLAGGVVTHVEGDIVEPGDPLPEDADSFDLTYWYMPTPVDIAAGAMPGTRLNVSLVNIPISWSNAQIRNAIMQLRAMNRQTENFGSEGSELSAGELE